MAERRSSSEDDESLRSVVVVDDIEQKNELKEFILLFETCPSLWNPNDKHYLNTFKKNEDLDKLIQIYKNMKPNATKDDVKKKINSLRSNYRKELKKIVNSKRTGSGVDDVYTPTSSTFHLLKFLSNIEKPKLKKDDGSSEVRCEEDNSLVISSITNEGPPVKIRKNSGTLAKQNELLNRACSLLSQPSQSSRQDVNPLALVWSDKLNSLNPNQKLYAEKAINDILYEAQLNNLDRHSVQINTFASHSSPATSTPYPFTPSPVTHPYTPSPVAHVETLINENCETYIAPGASATYPSVSQENLIPDNCEIFTSPTYPPVLHIPESNVPIVHATGSTFIHQKPKMPSSSTRVQKHQTGTKVQSGLASKIILHHNSESNSDEYTLGSLFATFKPT